MKGVRNDGQAQVPRLPLAVYAVFPNIARQRMPQAAAPSPGPSARHLRTRRLRTPGREADWRKALQTEAFADHCWPGHRDDDR